MLKPGSYIKDLLIRAPTAGITVHGWVKTRRDSKAVHFVQVNDGSSFRDLQVVIESSVVNDADLSRLTTGASVRVQGDLVESPAKGQSVELHARGVEILGDADPSTYPLQKKGHSFEFLRDIAHLRPRSNTFGTT